MLLVLRILNSDLYTDIGGEQFDCIVSNPPYVPAPVDVSVKDYMVAANYAKIIVLLMIARGIILIVGTMCSHYMGFRLETNLRITGLNKLMNASFAFFDKNSSGQIRKTIDDNAGDTHKTVAHPIPDNVSAVLTPICAFIMIFYIDYRLGILMAITTVIGILQYAAMYKDPELMQKSMSSLQEMSSACKESGDTKA